MSSTASSMGSASLDRSTKLRFGILWKASRASVIPLNHPEMDSDSSSEAEPFQEQP